MTDRARVDPTEIVLVDAFVLSACVCLVDLIKAHRTSTWAGINAESWLGAVLAIVLFTVLFSVLFLLAQRVSARFAESGGTMRCALALIAWAPVALYSGGMTSAGWAVALFLVGGYAALGFAAELFGAQRWRVRVAYPLFVFGTAGALIAGSALTYWQADRIAALNGVLAPIGVFLFLFAGLFSTIPPGASRTRKGVALFCLAGAVVAAAHPWVFRQRPAGMDQAGPARAPNLVFITTDCLRADVCSVYGGDTATPSMEALAARGVLFDRGYALGPWTLPSMFGLFASRIPPGLTPGAGRQAWAEEMTQYRFDADTHTLASQLNAEGYATAAYVGNSLLRDPEGILRGFETTRVVGHRMPVLYGPFESQPLLQGALLRLGLPVARERPIDSTAILAHAGESFLRSVGRRPFFLWIHFMDPHGPYAPPPAFAPPEGPWPVYDNADAHWGTPRTDEAGRVELTALEREHVQALYLGEVRYVDHRIGEVMAALDRAGLRDSTYICLTSDHGEEFWEHGEYGHGQSLYDEQVRVPLIVAGPGIGRQRIETPVTALDLMATFADWLGAPGCDRWQGTSFAEALRRPDVPFPVRPVFAQGTNLHGQPGPLRMVVKYPFKYVVSTDENYAALFDLAADPGEVRNLLAEGAHVPEGFDAALNVSAGLASGTVAERYEGESGHISRELEEEMRAFGYLH